MDIAIPVAPLGVLTLLGFFAPYAIAALNGILPFVKTPWQKKIVSIVVSLVLAAAVVLFYYQITGDTITDWWVFALLAIVIVNASYALVTRDTATAVERAADPNVVVVHETRRSRRENR
jgi:cell shape-determining protein MreD